MEANTTEATNNTLANILAAIDAGQTVHVATMTRITSWTPKAIARNRAAGAEPFKVGKDGCLRMLEGWSKGSPRYVTISLSTGSLLVGISFS